MNVLERFHSFLLGLESAVQIKVGKAFREVAEEITQEPICLCSPSLPAEEHTGSRWLREQLQVLPRAEEWPALSARSCDLTLGLAKGSGLCGPGWVTRHSETTRAGGSEGSSQTLAAQPER